MPEHEHDDEGSGQGFSTRAIRAAHRQPRVDQRPTSVPIYQTVTFSSDDAAELGEVLTGQRPGYAYGRIDNPTTSAFGRAVAELEGAEDGIALATGMAAIHAALVSLVSYTHFVVPPVNRNENANVTVGNVLSVITGEARKSFTPSNTAAGCVVKSPYAGCLVVSACV